MTDENDNEQTEKLLLDISANINVCTPERIR